MFDLINNIVAVIAPGPAIRRIPIGLIAISLFSSDSSCSAGVVLDRPTFESSTLRPFLKKSISPIIWNAYIVIPKKLKITDPRIENKISVKNAVREPFLAISFFSYFENLSDIIISIGEIPIGFIKANKVVRQSKKSVFRAVKIGTLYILSGELIPRILNPLFKIIFTALINLILAFVKSVSLVITLQLL